MPWKWKTQSLRSRPSVFLWWAPIRLRGKIWNPSIWTCENSTTKVPNHRISTYLLCCWKFWRCQRKNDVSYSILFKIMFTIYIFSPVHKSLLNNCRRKVTFLQIYGEVRFSKARFSFQKICSNHSQRFWCTIQSIYTEYRSVGLKTTNREAC